MKKLRNWFYYLFILASFPFMIWLAYSVSIDTYMFWKHGVQKKAEVIKLNYEGKYNFNNYEVKIEGNHQNVEFAYDLSIGKKYNVLTLPKKPEKITLGTRSSSLFKIFSYSVGGNFMAILQIIVFGGLLLVTPTILIEMVKKRREFLEQ